MSIIKEDKIPSHYNYQFIPPDSTNSQTITIRPHPKYETIIPKLKPEEYQELKKSIELHGLYHAIIINKAGYILDGHHRLRVCNENGIQPRFEIKNLGDSHREKMFVIDTNLARRHLEPYSRVELILLKKEEYLKLGKQRMSKAGEKGNEIKSSCGYDCKRYNTASKPILDKEREAESNKNLGFIEIDNPDTNINTDSPFYSPSLVPFLSSFNTQTQLAKESQVAPSTFYEAEYITRNGSTEQKEKLRNGQLKIHKVYTDLKQKDRLIELNRKIESGSSFSDLDILNNLNVSVKFSDVWTFGQLDERFGRKDYPGKTFPQVVFNTLYFFTEKGDMVVDPMAGGGVVGDVCDVMGRKCSMYDIDPVRKDIKKHNLVEHGLPKEACDADLVFWDPPYYKKKEEYYSLKSISALPRKEYLKVFENAAVEFAKRGVKKVALLISNYDDEYRGHPEENIFLHHYINQFEKTDKWCVCRIIDCPFSSKLIPAPLASQFLRSKKMTRLSRYLVVFVRTVSDCNDIRTDV